MGGEVACRFAPMCRCVARRLGLNELPTTTYRDGHKVGCEAGAATGEDDDGAQVLQGPASVKDEGNGALLSRAPQAHVDAKVGAWGVECGGWQAAAT